MPINWTKRAVRNLESVLDYIARDNELAVIKFRDFIIDKVAVLEQHRHMGRTCDVQGARELVIHETTSWCIGFVMKLWKFCGFVTHAGSFPKLLSLKAPPSPHAPSTTPPLA